MIHNGSRAVAPSCDAGARRRWRYALPAELVGNDSSAPRIVQNVIVGVVVCVAVLASATVFGTIWRRRNGVLRVVPGADAVSRGAASEGGSGGAPGTGAGAAGDGPSAAGAGRDARVAAMTVAAGRHGGVLTEAQLGRPLGSRATLVQFSTAFCAPCRATRRILAEVAGMVEGVTFVEVDAEVNLPLVRRLGIHSTPTVLVLGGDGAIARRGTGQPRKADVIAALGAVTGAAKLGTKHGAAQNGAAENGAAESFAAANGAAEGGAAEGGAAEGGAAEGGAAEGGAAEGGAAEGGAAEGGAAEGGAAEGGAAEGGAAETGAAEGGAAENFAAANGAAESGAAENFAAANFAAQDRATAGGTAAGGAAASGVRSTRTGRSPTSTTA